MNSAVGSALIAGVLSGVFAIAGVLLGARLQRRSANRERARAAAVQRDEILASLAGAVSTLLTQASVWHSTAWKLRLSEPIEVMGPTRTLRRTPTGELPDGERLARMEGEIERLRRDVILVVSEISVLCSRLEFIEPAMRALGEQLGVVVTRLIAGVGAPDEEFKTRRDEVRTASLAMDRRRNELAGEGGSHGRRAKRSQQGESGPEELAGE